MIGKKYFCDCCKKEVINPKEFYRVKVKSDAFINYASFDTIGAGKQTFDICQLCISRFKDYLRHKDRIGEWIPIDVGDCCYRCSVCNFVRDAYLLEEDNYCPHCGARMDGAI